MTDSEIIDIIQNLDKECEYYKDCGRTFIKRLAQKLKNTIDEDKQEVYNLFFKEIRNNDSGYIKSVALETFKELKDKQVCPILEKIYREECANKNDDWKNSIIETLMILKYGKPKDIYAEYVNHYLQDKYNEAFFLLAQYSNVDWERALPLLSSYCADNLSKPNEIQRIMIVRIGFLVYYLMENEDSYFTELVKQVALKNRNSAYVLKELIINNLNEFTNSNNYTIERGQKIVSELKQINL